ncbi:MAG: hypothetical protein E7371_00680 [Clostridiales bacterium]|nr:hypothetical protein [Clostridiales bacterium]
MDLEFIILIALGAASVVLQVVTLVCVLIKQKNAFMLEQARLEKEIERQKKKKKGVPCNQCGVRLSVKPDSNETYICPVCNNKFRVQKKEKK